MNTTSKPKTVVYTKLLEHKKGARIWVQGLRLAKAGYDIGSTYSICEDKSAKSITLKLDQHGKYVVSRKKQGEKQYPLIDMVNSMLENIFGKPGVKIRLLITAGRIIISLHADEFAKQERQERLNRKIANNEELDIGSVCHGIGVIDHAFHQGLAEAGIKSRLSWAIDIEGAYLQASIDNNEVWDDSTLAVHSALEDVEPNVLPTVEILIAGLPCVGASLAGRSRNKIEHAEQHETAGTAFYSFLTFVKKCNPTVILLENVLPYAKTVSMHVIREVLSTWGYNLYEEEVGRELGAFEDRNRLCAIAISEDIPFNLNLQPSNEVESNFGEIMEPIADDSPLWKTYEYLDKKQDRDIKSGKGFKMQLVTAESTKVGTIGRGYMKVRSTEPLVQHPTRPEYRRLLTVKEHAAVKKIPLHLVNNLSKTKAHEGLGQSALHPAFVSAGYSVGSNILKYSHLRIAA